MNCDLEISICGEMIDRADFAERLLAIPARGNCTIYFDSPGGDAFTGLALANLIRLRGLNATGIVIGQCSSAALWPFAACQQRFMTGDSVCYFHDIQSVCDRPMTRRDAENFASQVGRLESQMNLKLVRLFGSGSAKLSEWIAASRYVTAQEMSAAGLVQLLEADSSSLPFGFLADETHED